MIATDFHGDDVAMSQGGQKLQPQFACATAYAFYGGPRKQDAESATKA
jgi:hypothetical protein